MALIHYEISAEKCIGCTACARNCPVECIAGKRREPHMIDQVRCIKCGRCFEVCRFAAVSGFRGSRGEEVNRKKNASSI